MSDLILDTPESSGPHELIPSTTGVRFANFLIDLVIFYIFIILFVSFTLIMGLDFAETLAENPILDRIFSLIMYGLFMAFQEIVFKGRSIAKFITGTYVVDENEQTPPPMQLLKRNMLRAVPFDQLSFFGGRGWHDQWSDTYVISYNPKENI